MRIVFDTNCLVSALLFPNGRLAWLAELWNSPSLTPLISQASQAELRRVLMSKKFALSNEEFEIAIAGYFPFCEQVAIRSRCEVICRDEKDQMFLDLAQSGTADVLVTGDSDLLTLAGRTDFLILSPIEFREFLETSSP